MLLQFNVTNYLSFKKEAILSLYANSDKAHETSLLNYNKEKLLPTIAIYGANAAGKSNLTKAIQSAISIVRNSNLMQLDTPISQITPFLLDESSRNEKTRFDFIFVYNNKKYEYGFTADRKLIYEEYLYEYTSSKASKIFERSNVNSYEFTSKSKSLASYIDKNLPNKLFLSTATAWNSEQTKNAYRWFSEGIDVFTNEGLQNNLLEQLQHAKYDKDNSLNDFIVNMLKKADINISGFDLTDDDSNNIITKHTVLDKEYLLNFDLESNGTKRLFSYSPIIKEALELGKTIVIDEIDNCLHPMLTKALVEMFQDKQTNKNGAQLIFNTHEINLLDLDLLRRDQIYFVEKKYKTATSDLYSLDEFSPRNNENINKGYMQGRYGAVPFINLGENPR